MKKYKINVDRKEVMHVEKAINIGLLDEKTVKLNVVGSLNIEQVLDMLNTAAYELLETTYKLTDGDKKVIKNELYQRAVLGFSLMIDKFHPEGIKTRFNGLTEEAVMKAQNEILLNKQRKA